MRIILPAAAALALILSGCAREVAEAPAFDTECNTVYLFDRAEFRTPAADVPDEIAAYVGHWTDGAWSDGVCHDLWILAVDAEANEVLLIDAHGPGPFPDATAFRRRARLMPDGSLRITRGARRRDYWIDEQGFLRGRQYVLGEPGETVVLARKPSS